MISKELLSEVLGYEVLSYNGIHHDYILDGVTHTGYPLNIYELAHKCKEWACSKEYKDIGSWRRYDSDNDSFYWMVVVQVDSRIIPISNKTFTSDTEPEAIFKACEWILKEQQ